MFAKLKKKIQEEGGGASIDGDRSAAAGPYGSPYTSPISKDAPGNSFIIMSLSPDLKSEERG